MSGSSRQSPARPGNRPSGPPAAGSADVAELTRLLEPVVSAAGMDLENVRVTAAGRRRLLRVVVDADGGVSLDDIAQISRDVSAELDATAAMGEAPYTLEVSSPGVDRPLTEPRHWRRATGRLVRVPLASRSRGGQARPPGGRGGPGHWAPTTAACCLTCQAGSASLATASSARERYSWSSAHVTADADGGETDGH